MAEKLVKIELLAERSIRGKVAKKGTQHEVHKGVADVLVAGKFAKLI
jgi:hypothetical protein